ncbi:hypothetical protein BDD43_2328 [Mucilaginibacter gracilis]|uniref:Double-GTPase 1 domain-containing protein n=1 Tax=Mucilaginibacter gracilis TaxID=423350 RepID=A0A495J2C0_9SPHI|nr:hypothetical protein [Mucilaginibacter gracilis]RKR82159.1 hypothetical protein BDD43_2328 [Mucilaginibacter gracilis]
MKEKSIILVGGPDSGKSNYLARLWLAIQSQKYDLLASTTPGDVRYVESIAEHLLQGQFVPRTEPEEKNREFHVSVKTKDESIIADIIVPDILGEIWGRAVSTLEIPEKWLKALRKSTAAVLFVRVQSENNVNPLNWVTSQELLKIGIGDDKEQVIPTQIVLMELLRFIDENINRKSNTKPKVAIVVTAFDLLHVDEAKDGPQKYLEDEFPMFAGRISDIDTLEVKVFGSSVVSGDFEAEGFTDQFFNRGIHNSGYIVELGADGKFVENDDITIPINWLLNVT